MNRLLLKLAMTVMVGGRLHSTPAATQASSTTKKAASLRITRGPEIERWAWRSKGNSWITSPMPPLTTTALSPCNGAVRGSHEASCGSGGSIMRITI